MAPWEVEKKNNKNISLAPWRKVTKTSEKAWPHLIQKNALYQTENLN